MVMKKVSLLRSLRCNSIYLVFCFSLVDKPTPKVAPSVVDLVHAADMSVLESKGIKPAHRFEVGLILLGTH